MSLNIPLAVRALRLTKFPLPLPRVLFGAAVAQLHSAKRHLVDPIDQFAHVFLIRLEPKFVLRFGFAQPRHQYVRIIWNANTVRLKNERIFSFNLEPGMYLACATMPAKAWAMCPLLTG
jgi:hypothetical protein